MSYRYLPEVLDELLRHGIRPAPVTPPRLAHDLLSDLYRYELRRLRDRLVQREIPKPQYSSHVVALRRRYPLLSLPLPLWTKPSPPDESS